jgi:Fanconi anemia group M protein
METPVIIADHREKRSGLPDLLSQLGFTIEYKQLEAGDYIIGERFIIERKTASDFILSMQSNRIFDQCRKLHRTHHFPLLLLEGNPYSIEKSISRNTIQGAMLAINAGWQIPIIYARDLQDSASIITHIIQQQIKRRRFLFHRSRTNYHKASAQQIFVEGLPGIGGFKAEALLKKFGCITHLVNASEKELSEVNGIGCKSAKKIRRFLDGEMGLDGLKLKV